MPTMTTTTTDTAPVVAPTTMPCTCGEMTAPDGTCLNIGACTTADDRATRGAARVTSKYAVPAAWNSRGGVD